MCSTRLSTIHIHCSLECKFRPLRFHQSLVRSTKIDSRHNMCIQLFMTLLLLLLSPSFPSPSLLIIGEKEEFEGNHNIVLNGMIVRLAPLFTIFHTFTQYGKSRLGSTQGEHNVGHCCNHHHHHQRQNCFDCVWLCIFVKALSVYV